MDEGEIRFDVFSLNKENHIVRLFSNLSLTVAEILSGAERDDFDKAIMHFGWSGTSPGWTGFKPVVILPHGELIKHEQFKFLIELA